MSLFLDQDLDKEALEEFIDSILEELISEIEFEITEKGYSIIPKNKVWRMAQEDQRIFSRVMSRLRKQYSIEIDGRHYVIWRG